MAAQRKRDKRSVYFIQAVDGGPIKIGVAANPRTRLRELQRSSPAPLRILGVVNGVGRDEEKRLHDRFKTSRTCAASAGRPRG